MKVLQITVVLETSEEAHRLGYRLAEETKKFLEERFGKKPIDYQWTVRGEETTK